MDHYIITKHPTLNKGTILFDIQLSVVNIVAYIKEMDKQIS